VDYYIIRKQLYISAAPFVSYTGFFDLSLDENVIVGNPHGSNYSISEAANYMDMNGFNYGVAIGAGYEFNKHRLNLNVCLNMRNITQGMQDENNKIFNTHIATVL